MSGVNNTKGAPTFFIDDMMSNLEMTARLYAQPGVDRNNSNGGILLGYAPLSKDAFNFSYSHEFVHSNNFNLTSRLIDAVNKAQKTITATSQKVSAISDIASSYTKSNKDLGILNDILKDDITTKLTTHKLVSATENSNMYDGTTISPPISDLSLIYVSGMKYGDSNQKCNVKNCLSTILQYTIGDYSGASALVNNETDKDLFGFIESPNGFNWSDVGISSTKKGSSDPGTFYLVYGMHDSEKVINDLLITGVNIRVSPYKVKGTNDYYYAIVNVHLELNKLRTRKDLISWMGLSAPDTKSIPSKETEKDESKQVSHATNPNNVNNYNINNLKSKF